MSQEFQKNQSVQWNFGSGVGKGKIKDAFISKVTRTIKGSEVTRNATEEEPAYLIHQDDGDEVLKCQSELTKA
ncbi:hypothetical protein Poly24_28420 [Rosistilla carotiformis]|uniref:Hypervirulence associated protein TUDOR domain-containing protein n=1 Tax=Rosistilla carotiformis TaxID=2528017 RepID=A0A518JUA7_9BACT|nr:DUF2945 domain-containing protein [Rosistilla carotiformis]QDV69128.1 hypothetical protein Poly24_28420 [Rosistilla carotiformis]